MMILIAAFMNGCGSQVGDNRHTVDISSEIGIQENLDVVGDGTSTIANIDSVAMSAEQEQLAAQESVGAATQNAETSGMEYPSSMEGIE